MEKEVYFIKDDVVKVNASMLREMKEIAAQNLSGKIRYCFHECEEAAMQEMLFVIPEFGYSRPHMHRDVAESHVILDGEGYCILFDLYGGITDYFKVSPNEYFTYRIQKGIFHMVIPVTMQMVIYEIREGRFEKDTNIYAKWAPNEKEKGEVEQYKAKVLEEIRGY